MVRFFSTGPCSSGAVERRPDGQTDPSMVFENGAESAENHRKGSSFLDGSAGICGKGWGPGRMSFA